MTFAYDELTDSILVFSKRTKDQIKGSATVSNLVLDFTKDGKVVGLEIKKATPFLKAMGFPKKISDIDSADLRMNQTRDGFVLIVELKFGKQSQKLPLFVPTETLQLAIA